MEQNVIWLVWINVFITKDVVDVSGDKYIIFGWNLIEKIIHQLCYTFVIWLCGIFIGMTKTYSWIYYFNRCKDISLGKFRSPFKAITMSKNHLTFCNFLIWFWFLLANRICQKQFPFDQKIGNASAVGLANWLQFQTSTYEENQ